MSNPTLNPALLYEQQNQALNVKRETAQVKKRAGELGKQEGRVF